MLFKTTDELREYLPANVTFQFGDVKPYLRQAENRWLRRALGEKEYANLQEKYEERETTPLNDTWQELLALCQLAVANLAFMLYIPFGQVEATSTGFKISVSDTQKTAFEWQIRKLEASFRDTGLAGLEDVLAFLEAHTEIFTDWKASQACTQYREGFVSTTEQLAYLIPNVGTSRRLFLALRPAFRSVEQRCILPVLGKALFQQLKEEMKAGNVSEAHQELIEWIRPVVAHLALAEGLDDLAVTLEDDGITLFDNSASRLVDSRGPADLQRVGLLRRKREADGYLALQELTQFLLMNGDDYPLYEAPASPLPPNPTSGTFFTG
ncbi:hypothetical protein SAMN05421823_102524 [Catalinimonas alkaloidigena]|uniref:Uncharacterized protein n=1 Tax=Catalinimonas alkaloidigena TaxID=1075417 RepID=A0A1G9B7Y4_9BACT|nr:DUF6712 family protein [Catalinimonas alkaloidigena]SDK34965.1 hypothetical protein SAMN05421823_102524 [Catalinimonas alkaloidigena]